ncbi:hypothetical protein C5C66_00130 [Rathayibacter toxicus]|uniref:Nuclear transport factor 2 family protein n=1 Tax=Rathayibacter toxicus TaxID=145458 RepID=A0A0C5BQB8_9MICO|nr:hypothetical protein [Rathayibacter toxicus]AJM76837.1 hypothetical protein TI83_00325 [Rathayibacter toxicus]ALS57404.1 hypothetical protein APU90_06155 [Rathayibacter toxicus]KKM45636.1 hypothetical protein VT73_05550 [Rathayibacter toxicus]PPG24717.1 hypothetical protein C5D15_00130 [Rathayibacter toxicus]PPG48171.1 hypothetical protein C5D16_00140 [Rathayibacter toxicus]
MSYRLLRGGAVVGILLTAASALTACGGTVSDPTTTPAPEAWRSQLSSVMAAFDAADESALDALFPSHTTEHLQSIYHACSAISSTGRRTDASEGDSPRLIVVKISGVAKGDESTAAHCDFQLYWNDKKTWELN